MREFEITLTLKDGQRVVDSVKATSKFDAEKVMRARYPGCVIWKTIELK